MPVARYFFPKSLPLVSSVVRRFESPEGRFRLAVTSGFVISAVGVLILGVGAKFGVADTIWGIMDIPGLTSPSYQAAQEPSPQYRAQRQARLGEDEGPARHRKHRKHKHLAAFGDQPTSLARKSICVRTCDGFAFPVGNYYGDGDKAAHEATCQSACPGAKTALYVLPAGSDTLADATSVSTGKTYSQMPDAFHYTNYVDESCSCHPAGGSRTKSLLRDFTLRRGDTVMTPKGLEVFHGGNGYPFKRRDFVALNRSRDIQQATRQTLKAIERASLVNPTTLAGWHSPAAPKTAAAKPAPAKKPPAMTSDAGRDAAKGTQHQAKS